MSAIRWAMAGCVGVGIGCGKGPADDTGGGESPSPEALPAPLVSFSADCGDTTLDLALVLDAPVTTVDVALAVDGGTSESHRLTGDAAGTTWAASLVRSPGSMESGVSTSLDCTAGALDITLLLESTDGTFSCFHRGAAATEWVDALCMGESTPF